MPLRRRVFHRLIPYNDKIADISEADTADHTLDLETALGETRKIISILLWAARISGTGSLWAYPNEGAIAMPIGPDRAFLAEVAIKDGTQRLKYYQSVAGDDWDLYCFGYVVEA